MDLGNATENLTLLGGGGLSMMAFARWYFARVMADMDERQKTSERRIEDQARELAALKDERVAKVETDVATLREDGCKAGAVVHAKMETLISQSNELLGGMHQLQRQSAAQTEKLDLMDRSASKLWEKFDDHRQHHPGKTAGG